MKLFYVLNLKIIQVKKKKRSIELKNGLMFYLFYLHYN